MYLFLRPALILANNRKRTRCNDVKMGVENCHTKSAHTTEIDTSLIMEVDLFNTRTQYENDRYTLRLTHQLNEQNLLCN